MGRPKKEQSRTPEQVEALSKQLRDPSSDIPPLEPNDEEYLNDYSNMRFINTGSTRLNCILGGGWAMGRVSTVEGGESSGKTQLAIEACANLARDYKSSPIWYHDAEASFDFDYAVKLGLPRGKRVEFTKEKGETLEDMFNMVVDCAHSMKDGQGGLFIVDSLDPIRTEAQMKGAIGEAKMLDAHRAAILSDGFRRSVRLLKQKDLNLLIVQQLRTNIGGMGLSVSGGKAIKFYASQRIRLLTEEIIKRDRGAYKQVPVGIKSKATSKKSKVGLPYQTANFNIMFNYGIDDELSCLEYLQEVDGMRFAGDVAVKTIDKKTGEILDYYKSLSSVMDRLAKLDPDEYDAACRQITRGAVEAWEYGNSLFMPKRSKYQLTE